MSNLDQLFLLSLAGVIAASYLSGSVVFEGDAADAYRYAQFLAGVPAGVMTTWRPPGYPIFLIATGQIAFDSFRGTMFVQALFAVLCPLLMFHTLAPINRRLALLCGLFDITTSLPFSYITVMLSQNLYSFPIILLICLYSRYYFTKRPLYIYLSAATSFSLIVTQYEMVLIPLLLTIFVLIRGRRRRGQYRAAFLSIALVLAGTVARSWERSVYIGQPEFFGSLHNDTAHVMFLRIYCYGTDSVTLAWERNLFTWNKFEPTDITRDGRGLVLIRPRNGPNSAKLVDFINALPSMPPSPDLYPPKWKQTFFSEPDYAKGWALTQALNARLGSKGAEELLRGVVAEAMIAHPIILWDMMTSYLWYFGINLSTILQGTIAQHFPIGSLWAEDELLHLGYNGHLAKWYLTDKMMRSYDHSFHPPWLSFMSKAIPVGDIFENYSRNIIGPLFMVLIWFIPFSRYRVLFLFVALVPLLLITSNVAAYGFAPRYEHASLQIICMAAICGFIALREVLQRRRVGRIADGAEGA